MRVELVERADERVVGVEAGVLPVQEQRQPVRLIAVEAVIAASGQVEAKEERSRQATEADRVSHWPMPVADRQYIGTGSFPWMPT